MLPTLLLCSGLLAAEPAGLLTPSDADLRAYEAAQAKVGRDATAHVRLALWCEAHALSAEKAKQLALAVLVDPQNATARGLMGLVSYRGKWQSPQAVGEQAQSDPQRAEVVRQYLERRAKAPDTADAQWKLALWCEQNGLKAEAAAHFTTVVRLDPGREPAWKHLGYKRQNGRWVVPAQAAAEKAEAEAQKKANRHWKPLLEKWRGQLADPRKKDAAERALAGVTDPRAVPAVWSVFGVGDAAQQAVAVQLLGQIEAPEASRALAVLAALSPSPNVRKIASETLRKRDPRDFVGLLIALFRAPIRYEVRPVGGIGSPGVLFVEGKQYNVRRLYGPPALPLEDVPPRLFDPSQPFDPFSLRNLMAARGIPLATGNTLSARDIRDAAAHPQDLPSIIARQNRGQASPATVDGRALGNELATITAQQDLRVGFLLDAVQRATADAQRQLDNDISTLEASNARAQQVNQRASSVLKLVTDQDLGTDSEAWQKWWTDQQGYAYRSTPEPDLKPTLDQFIASPISPAGPIHSCFAAGTSVQTLGGTRPIESIAVGDRILSQDTRTGALDFQTVLTIYHNPPSATLRVRLGDETVVATGIHRFWKAGKGWTMARDLKPGDVVRALGGTARVDSVEAAAVQAVYNLEVGEHQSFFVGARGFLVHDNSLVRAVAEPFDAAHDLAAAGP